MSKADSKELSPGKVLKALREERNLTLEDIHERTRVSIKKLALIEEDSYSQFEAPVFVRGYIRSYARFVGGDGNNLVRLYDQLFIESDARLAADQIAESGSPESSQHFLSNFSKNFINKTSIWSVVGALAALWLITMLIFGGDSESETDYVPVDKTASAGAVAASPTDQNLSMASDPSTPASSMVSGSTVSGSTVSGSTVGSASADDRSSKELSNEQLEEPPVSEGKESLAVSEPMQRAPQPGVSNQLVGQTDETDAVSDTSSARNEDGAVESFLGFQFTDECWVEVRDAFDKVIFADIKNKGDNLRLSGVAPFDIMLGNARATELTVDGEPVELRVPSNRKTLRLTVFAK